MIHYAIMYDVFWECLCLRVCLFLLTVLGCRVCELCDDTCWIMCAFVFMLLFNVFVCFVCDLLCDTVWSVVVRFVVLCVCAVFGLFFF